MRNALTALGAFAAGATALYLTDPEHGRRRRAALGRRAAEWAHEAAEAAQRTGRQASSGLHALAREGREAGREAADRLQDLAQDGRRAGRQAADRAQDLADEGRHAGRDALERLQDAADEGRQAGRRAWRRAEALARAGRERLAARADDEPAPRERPAASGSGSLLLKALAGIAVGAAVVYLRDPAQRRQRLALVRDQALQLGQRVGGLLHRGPPDDAVLAQRVRAVLGGAVSHPGAIEVDAAEGRVTLGGDVLAAERARLFQAVASVPGVIEVRDALEVHGSAAGVPALQGGQAPAGLPQDQAPWVPTPGLLALAGGAALLLYGASRRGLPGLLAGGLGLGLSLRAARDGALREQGARLLPAVKHLAAAVRPAPQDGAAPELQPLGLPAAQPQDGASTLH